MPTTTYPGCTPCCPQPTVTTACCPSDPTPQTLHVTLSAGQSGSFTLTYNSGAGNWQNNSAAICGDHTSVITLQCVTPSDVWNLAIQSNGGTGCSTAGANAFSATCSPFSLVFHMSAISTCCSGTFTVTVTP